jgi:hypothetical protein
MDQTSNHSLLPSLLVRQKEFYKTHCGRDISGPGPPSQPLTSAMTGGAVEAID